MLPNEREAVERNGNCDQSNDNQNENTGGESVNKVHDEDAVRSELQNEIKKEVENKIGDKQKESEKDESSNANQNTNSASISANTNFESDEIYRLMLAEAQKPRADILFSNSQSQQQTSAETTTATTQDKIFDIPTSPTKVSHSTPTNRVKSSASNPSTNRIKRSRRRSNRTSKITTWEKRFQQTLTASNNRESAPTAMDVDSDNYDRNVEMDKRNNSIIDDNDEDDFANVKNINEAVKKRKSSSGGNHKKRNIRITPKSTSAWSVFFWFLYLRI
ncbi:unnamed protein product [Anisakis simplex]|uniref:Uncharacterized protein n=1 Tax=Anisakis simplex TaxID=6269 RepID=A0A0M3J627_ANISI|nr:unnamed protein product [Anisakis simplex]